MVRLLGIANSTRAAPATTVVVVRICLLVSFLLVGCPEAFVVGEVPEDALGDGDTPPSDAPRDSFGDSEARDASTDASADALDSGPTISACEGLVEASPVLDVSCGDPARVEPVERTNRFGYALALGDEELFVAAPGYREGLSSGGVAVYGAAEGGYRLTQWLISDGIGWSMAQRGTRLLVGAPLDKIVDEDADYPGFVAEYERQDCGWVRTRLIDSPAVGAARDEDRFGASISLHDDFAIIGSGRTEGVANLFYSMQYSMGAWALTDTISCGTQATQEHKLHSTISADGQTVLLRNDEDAVLCLFRRAETEALLWEPAGTIALDGSVNFQGANVSLSNGLVFVGSSGLRFVDTLSRVRAGAVRVFTLTPDGLTELPDLIVREPMPTAGHEFGLAVHAECDSISRECALWVVSSEGSEDADEAGVLWRVVWHRVDGVRSIERRATCPVGSLGEIGRQAVFRGDEAFVSSPVYGRAWRVVD